MPANISFTCQTLRGTNKAGLLKPDENGYYTVLLGGFNLRNEMGNFYPFNKYLEEIFKASSTFMRRVERGHLRGEMDHPQPWKGMTEREWFSRLRKIDMGNVSHHIRKVTLDFQNYRSQHGETMVAVLGEVKPAGGPIGDKLKASLDNPDEDTCFSIRTLTLDQPMVTGAWRKDVYELVTWDWVPEPGVRNATKYHSPGLESFQEYSFSPQTLKDVLVTSDNGTIGYGMESGGGDMTGLQSLLKDYQAEAGQTIVTRKPFMRW
ncbi:capsid assembly protease [Erwinia phage AH06]|nr:capsid assembly protease [Erwinia phage AH06]